MFPGTERIEMSKRGRKVGKFLCVVLSILMIVSIMNLPSWTIKAKANEGVRGFVERLYTVILDRPGDKAGIEYWEDQILTSKATGAHVAVGFVFTDEYYKRNRSNGEFVNDMYNLVLGRDAEESGYNYWVEKLDNGEERLSVFAGFVNSNEYYNICNDCGITAGYFYPGYDVNQINAVNLFVERLYKTTLGRTGDIGGQEYWVRKLLDGELTGTYCASNFILSPEYQAKELSNEDYIESLYAAFMGRSSDYAGKKYWVDNLKHGLTRDELFAGFANSQEFNSICESYNIANEVYIPTDISNKIKDMGVFVAYFSAIDKEGDIDTVKGNSDTNIIAVINTRTHHIQLVNTPRDYYVDVPYSGESNLKDTLNHAGQYGVDQSIGTLENLYGVKIDYYFKINFDGFVNIVDQLDGVNVYSDYTFDVDPAIYGRSGHYEKGYNYLDGKQALTFVRERAAFETGDGQRIINNMYMLTALIAKATARDTLNNYDMIINNIRNSYRTNMTEDMIIDLVFNQMNDPSGWKVDTYAVKGIWKGNDFVTYTYPDSPGYASIPDEESVAEATRRMNAVLYEVK